MKKTEKTHKIFLAICMATFLSFLCTGFVEPSSAGQLRSPASFSAFLGMCARSARSIVDFVTRRSAYEIRTTEVQAATERLRAFFPVTPLQRSRVLSELLGHNIYLKLDTECPTGAFKVRGVLNFLTQRTQRELRQGFITATTGNHAIAMGYGLRHFDTTMVAVMPTNSSPHKRRLAQQMGVRVIVRGANFNEAQAFAERIVEEEGRIFLPTNEDRDVMTGYTTIAVEALEQLPSTTMIVGPAGGGATMAGIGQLIRQSQLRVQTVAVQPEAFNPLVNVMATNGQLRETDGSRSTIAGGTASVRAYDSIAELYLRNVDSAFAVSEGNIAEAMRLLNQEGVVVEGAAALPLAYLLQFRHQLPQEGQNIVLLVTGRNIDSREYEELLSRP